MEITYQTNISELINVDQVQDQVSSIESVIDEYSNRGDEVLREQLASNLSESSFYYGTNHPIFDKATSICISFSDIDKSALSNIISKAKEKREEELITLRKEVQNRIEEIYRQLLANLFSVKNLTISTDPNAPNEIEKIKESNKYLIDEKESLEKKIEKIESELGGL
jgi:hypothetical protein